GWEDRHAALDLAWTDCHYGGRRPWFVCPGCGRRAAVLYLGGAGWRCRRCERLVYRSQRQGQHDRALTKARRLRARLGGGAGPLAPFPPRPRGMHRATYARLRREAAAAEAVYDAAAWAV
ncbi:MAG TPA: hypothetical protein VFL91_20955, partial [Thermomicrobiales bacterium]|nr:hypothetical protein [Thermomicrobiales bacterium]